MLWRAKHRAKVNNLDFNLEVSDIDIPETCPILGIQLVQGEGRLHASSPVLDRIDNEKGYIKGNVCVISQRANQMKTNMSIEQVERLLGYMRGY